MELSRRAGWRAACLGFSTTASRVTSGPVSWNELLDFALVDVSAITDP